MAWAGLALATLVHPSDVLPYRLAVSPIEDPVIDQARV